MVVERASKQGGSGFWEELEAEWCQCAQTAGATGKGELKGCDLGTTSICYPWQSRCLQDQVS